MKNNLIGFSTGPLARYNVEQSLEVASKVQMDAIELSFLRKRELVPYIENPEKPMNFDLTNYKYVSIHAPSDMKEKDESDIAYKLYQSFFKAKRNIILHPNSIIDFSLWDNFGNLVLIENMDLRRGIGKTTNELLDIFDKLTDASFCLDIGHARQIDGSMTEAINMIRTFSDRLKEVHISEVGFDGTHTPISKECAEDFKKIIHMIPENVPFIIESPVKNANDEIDINNLIREIEIVKYILE